MQQRTLKILYNAHSWMGVVTGLILFVVCFTGTVALFHYELATWENPGYRINETEAKEKALPVQQIIDRATQEHGFVYDEFFITLPGRFGVPVTFYHFNEETHELTKMAVDPTTGEKLQSANSNIVEFQTHMHTDLNLPEPWGRYLVGLFGIILLFSIVTGVLSHRKYFKEFFKFRPNRSWRLLLTDTHKVMGAWGILFHTMIAFTGAVIGLVGLFLLVMAYAAYGGDREAAIEGFVGPHIEESGVAAPMYNVDQLVTKAEQHWQGFRVEFVSYHGFGDENARVTLGGSMEEQLASVQQLTFDGVSGAMTFESDFMDMGAGARIYGASFALHYALYGGFMLKLLYMVLGASVALMTVTGMMIWLEKRHSEDKRYRKLSSATCGICMGLVVATATLFVSNQLISRSIADKPFYEELIYFISWLLCIFWAFYRGNNYQATKELLLVSGALLLAAPILNAINTGDHILASLQKGYYTVAGTDILLITFAITCWLVAKRLPHSRPESEHKSKAKVSIIQEPVSATS
ncbi:PepSY domain-containing protein [Pleionea sp. CnH1-48]|uniref:PepSY-associated TM helix domain-containing protein n=1 Tax=Pleionea sp. CnH1-48 TaxID=2954494 RepID=UPI00209807A6|nr:PepSY-associated TM helix domain-containing protein [Pleionea sp. CnH1-48]MCO7224555.1 PepSY domain-containing protein [Pleionea sp. CnH1-48]